jgi:tetratricopeptide (TPR) repeat protein
MQYNLAFTYYQLGRFADARAPLAGAVERWPDLFSLNALYGAVLWQLGEVQPAYQALKRARQLNADDSGTADLLYAATLELAKKSEAGGLEAEALGYLKEAASLKPAAPEPHQQMLSIYTRAGRADLARPSSRNWINWPNPRRIKTTTKLVQLLALGSSCQRRPNFMQNLIAMNAKNGL